jgi:hypothetical protein
MDTLAIPVVIGADRRLVIDLPPSTPIGPAEVVIRPSTGGTADGANPAREKARATLLAAGFLTTDFGIPEGDESLSDEDIARLGRLRPGARPSEELIAEDRGNY